MQKTVQILNGPSKEELFDGLRLFTERRQVSFIISNSLLSNPGEIRLPTIIQGIHAEDGSGESWNLTVTTYVRTLLVLSLLSNEEALSEHKNHEKQFTSDKEILANPPLKIMKVYYSTRSRKGVIVIE